MSLKKSAAFLTLVILFLHGVYCIEMMSNYFKIYPCNHQEMTVVMRSPSLGQELHPTLSLCALACSTRAIEECYYAIYRPSNSSCNFIGHAQNLQPLPDYLHEDGCTAMGKIDDVTPNMCQNGGVPFNYTCVCPKEYTGRFCELNNPSCCQNVEWRLATEKDHPMLFTSQIPIKMVFDSDIVSLKSFDANAATLSILVAQQNNYLLVYDETKEIITLKHPTEMLLTSLNPSYEVSENITANMKLLNGEIIDLFPKGLVAKFYLPSVLDDERLFKNGSLGLIADVTNALSKGHRLIRRVSTRVGFDVSTNDAFFGIVKTNLEVSNSAKFNWSWPLSYRSYKESLKPNTRYVLRQTVSDPHMVDDYQEVAKPYWEIDKCWTKIKETEHYDEFTSVLKEFIERGKEIRVVLNGKIAWDIIDIRSIKYDVIANLAPYVTPFDADGRLSVVTSNLWKSVISRTKKFAECKHDLQGSNSIRYSSTPYPNSVEWYVSTKPWTKLYSVSGAGEVLHGNKSDLYHAALHGKNIRVCFQRYTNFKLCESSTSLKMTKDQGLIFQFSAMMVLSNKETFNDIYHSNCRLKMYVMSSDGWMKAADIGQSNTNLVHNSFIKADWFVEG